MLGFLNIEKRERVIMLSLPEQYKEAKVVLKTLESDILKTSPVSEGDLIQDDKTETHYRVGYIRVDTKGDLLISTKEIKNFEVNWCGNTITYAASTGLNFKKVDWCFDNDTYWELQEEMQNTDSISEKEKLQEQAQQMNLECFHEWEFGNNSDVYECAHCGCEAIKSETQGTFGRKEVYNIDC